jgi:hypothetical protein
MGTRLGGVAAIIRPPDETWGHTFPGTTRYPSWRWSGWLKCGNNCKPMTLLLGQGTRIADHLPAGDLPVGVDPAASDKLTDAGELIGDGLSMAFRVASEK